MSKDYVKYRKYYLAYAQKYKERTKVQRVIYNRNNKEFIDKRARKHRDYLRGLVLNHYGPCCCWCGEKDINSLQIDHILNNGRDQKRYGENLSLYIIKNNYPNAYQILCADCNQLKRKNHGVLPKYRFNRYASSKISAPVSLAFGMSNDNIVKYKRERKYRINTLGKIFEAYTNYCVWCGESDMNCLEVDHINNDGNIHRKALKNKSLLFIAIVSSGFPDNIQILCSNCNFCKSKNKGILPDWRKDLHRVEVML